MAEYQGVEHTVTVRQDAYEWQGRPYKSLSAIARQSPDLIIWTVLLKGIRAARAQEAADCDYQLWRSR